ncbi:hypothetical protein PspLS_11818 [Pyricularia sp. CBS 133598]|nr:hypothetical protein PspLS_11818 [Pyricularia sp. CBS 133598]
MSKEDNITAAAFPPPGVSPDFAHPQDVLFTINIVAQIASMVLVTPFVGMRVYAKVYISPPFLREDYVSVLAWVLAMAYNATSLMSRPTLPAATQRQTKLTFNHSKCINTGVATTFGNLEPSPIEDFSRQARPHSPPSWYIANQVLTQSTPPMQALYSDTLIYSFATYFTKVALLLVIARVFSGFRKTYILTIFLIVAMVFYYLPILFLKVNLCSPIRDFWMIRGVDGIPNCIDRWSIFVADTVVSVITDTAVLIIPIPAVVSLRIPLHSRFKVWSMLGLGGVATVASVTRLVVLFRTIRDSTDQTVDFVNFNLLGTAEINIGLICACLPAINIIFSKARESRQLPLDSNGRDTHIKRLRFLRGSRLQTATDMTLGTQLRHVHEDVPAPPDRGVIV